MQQVIVRVDRKKWAVVTEYAHTGGIGRQGWWCEDEVGGWGTSDHGPADAIAQCVRPVTYTTRRAAQAAIDECRA